MPRKFVVEAGLWNVSVYIEYCNNYVYIAGVRETYQVSTGILSKVSCVSTALQSCH